LGHPTEEEEAGEGHGKLMNAIQLPNHHPV